MSTTDQPPDQAAVDAAIRKLSEDISKADEAAVKAKADRRSAVMELQRMGLSPLEESQPPSHSIAKRNENDFIKSIPNFRYGDGDQFQSWKAQVEGYADHYEINPTVLKRIVFLKVSANTGFSLVRLLNPTQAPYDTMSASEYMTKLENVFEPAAESENQKLEFQARHQMPNELAQVYFNEKRSMFMRAYPIGQRDWSAFFDQAISGLTNSLMREKLREFDIQPTEENSHKLGEQVVRWARLVRKRYLLGEISEAEVYGAEATPTTFSYTGGKMVKGLILKPDGMPIKSEPIHAINAVAAKKGLGPCWHCQGPHLLRDCTRKATGFPASVSAMDDGGINAASEPSTRGGKKSFRPFRRAGRGRGFKRFNQRVAYLFEDEQGNAYYDVTDGTEPEAEAEEATTSAPKEDVEESEGDDDDHFLEVFGL